MVEWHFRGFSVQIAWWTEKRTKEESGEEKGREENSEQKQSQEKGISCDRDVKIVSFERVGALHSC